MVYEVAMLKSKFISFLLLVPLIIGLPILYILVQPQNAQNLDYTLRIHGTPEIFVNCSLPQVVNKLPSLKVQCRLNTEDRAKMVALELFNFTGNISRPQFTEAYLVRNGSRSLWVSDSGGIWYDYFDPNYFPTNLPNFNEARFIAERLIAKMIQYGLTPQNPRIAIYFQEVAVGSQSLIPMDGTTKNIIHYLNAIFVIKFGNIKVSAITVSIGENGSIVGFQGFWRELQESNDIQIISPREAIEKLNSTGFGKTMVKPQKVIIERVEIVYFDDRGIQEHQDYLQPVYEFEGFLVDKNGVVVPFFQRIQATKS